MMEQHGNASPATTDRFITFITTGFQKVYNSIKTYINIDERIFSP